MAHVMKHGVFPLTAGVLLVTVGIVSGITVGSSSRDLNERTAELKNLEMLVNMAKVKAHDIQQAATYKASGASAERVDNDIDLIRQLADRALTWNSHESYVQARDTVMRAYNLTDSDAFMTSFLPEAPVNRDAQGNEYPYIDAAKLNSSAGGVSVKLLSVDALDYSYMALVDVSAASSDGKGHASNVATIFVTVDGEGALHDLSGFASIDPPRSSR